MSLHLLDEEAKGVEPAAVATVTLVGCWTRTAFPRCVAATAAVAMVAASGVFPASLVAKEAPLAVPEPGAPGTTAAASAALPAAVARVELVGCRVAAAPRVGGAATVTAAPMEAPVG